MSHVPSICSMNGLVSSCLYENSIGGHISMENKTTNKRPASVAAQRSEAFLYIRSIIKHFGSVSSLANQLGVNRQAIYRWQHRGAVPFEKATLISAMSQGQVTAPHRIISKVL